MHHASWAELLDWLQGQLHEQYNLRWAPCLDGPAFDLMPYCHGLKILNNFEQGISCFYFALGLANYAASLICHMVLEGIGPFPPTVSRKSSLISNFHFHGSIKSPETHSHADPVGSGKLS